jgi:hypothetical protein
VRAFVCMCVCVRESDRNPPTRLQPSPAMIDAHTQASTPPPSSAPPWATPDTTTASAGADSAVPSPPAGGRWPSSSTRRGTAPRPSCAARARTLSSPTPAPSARASSWCPDAPRRGARDCGGITRVRVGVIESKMCMYNYSVASSVSLSVS